MPIGKETRSKGRIRTTRGAPESQAIDPKRWVDSYCDALFCHALTRVADAETAKDLVQETLLAAWRSAGRFAGKASERTWLFRILRNKIADHYRKRRPEFAVETISELAQLEEKQFHQTGMGAGAWTPAAAPAHWSDATRAMEQSEFWEVVRHCTGRLPPNARDAFLLREIEGQSTGELCATLQISRNHLGVLLHRARLALRRCLEVNWFNKNSDPEA